jgi:homoserine kinase type II
MKVSVSELMNTNPLPREVLQALDVNSGAHTTALPGNENENCLVKFDDNSFVVKRLLGHSAANTESEGVYRQRLADSGLPVVPYLRLGGNTYVLTLGQDSFAATSYVEGNMAKPDGSVSSEAGVLLAKTHLLNAADLPDRKNWYHKNYVTDALDLVDDTYAEAKKAFVAQLSEYPDFWNGELPKGIIHGDLQRDNIIVDTQGKVVSLIDWEEAGTEPLLLDVAHSAQQLSFERGICDQELFHAFMTAYQNLRPLTDLEREWFNAALRYTMLVLSVWAHVKKTRDEMADDLFERVGNYYRASYKVPSL